MNIRRMIPILAAVLSAVLVLLIVLCLPEKDAVGTNGTADQALPVCWQIIYRPDDASSLAAAERIAAILDARESLCAELLPDTPEAIPPKAPAITVALTQNEALREQLGESGWMIEPADGILHLIAFGQAGLDAAVNAFSASFAALSVDAVSPDAMPRAFLAADGTSSETLFSSKIPLNFDEDGRFRMILFSDVSAGIAISPYTVQAIEKIVAAECPDLVLFCGGSGDGFSTRAELTGFLGALTAPLEAAGIPWAHLYAGADSLSRTVKNEVYAAFPHCVSKQGDYFLPIYHRGKPTFGIWMMSLPEAGGDYTETALTAFANRAALVCGRQGFPSVLALAAPLPEFAEAADYARSGELNETISAPTENSGLFALAAAADVRAIYAGQDHLNSYTADHLGIELGALASLGYDGYGFGGTFDTNHRLRGGRLVELSADGTFTSKMIFAADYGVER